MKQKVKITLHILLVLLILPIFSVQAFAAQDAHEEGGDLLSYLEDFKELLSEGQEEKLSSGSLGVDGILEEVAAAVGGEIGRVGRFFLFMLGVALLLCLAEVFGGDLSGAIGGLCSAAVFSELFPIMQGVRQSLLEFGEFFGGAVPVMCLISTGGGAVATAAAFGNAAGITLFAVGYIAEYLLIPLTVGIYCLGVLSSLGQGPAARMHGWFKQGFTKLVSVITAVISGVLALQTTVASAKDNASLRALRYAASNIIPVVGGTVSGAVSTLAGGMSYASAMVGGMAVGVVLLIAISPLVLLLLYRLCVGAVSFITDSFCSGKGVLGAVGSAIDCLTVLYSCSAVSFIIQSLVFASGGGAYV